MVTARTALLMLGQEYGPLLVSDLDFLFNCGADTMQREFEALLFPGYVLLPYLAEPVGTLLLPYWVGIWRIKCDPRISAEQAEQLLAPAEIDLVNPPLGDLVLVP